MNVINGAYSTKFTCIDALKQQADTERKDEGEICEPDEMPSSKYFISHLSEGSCEIPVTFREVVRTTTNWSLADFVDILHSILIFTLNAALPQSVLRVEERIAGIDCGEEGEGNLESL